MKLTILKTHLNESIQHVAKAISNRTTIPILSGIKIEANHQQVTLTASDTELSIQSVIALETQEKTIVQLHQPGSVVLPAKFFVEIIRKLPSENIEIEVSDNFHTLIRSGSSEIQMVGLDPEEYPLLPQLEENNVLSLPAQLLKSMIGQTVFAISTTETTPILTGVLCNLNNQNLKFVATDRHRLASREANINIDPELQFNNIVIPGKALNELNRILPDQEMMIDIVVADNQILFKIDSILFYSRILDGTYPDTSKIIPQTYKTELIVKTKELADAMDRAYLLSREEKTNIVRLITQEDQTIEVSSSATELGKVTELLNVEQMDGEPLKISFNSKYMLDVLKVIGSESIHIGFTGAMSPIIIKAVQQEQTLYLILPYRTSN